MLSERPFFCNFFVTDHDVRTTMLSAREDDRIHGQEIH